MLRSIKDIIGYPVEALDGSLGNVKDGLFDDRHWGLRYLVVDTRKWLPGRKVLVSPHHAKSPQTGWHGKQLPVELSKEQIKGSPELEEHAPVSKKYEQEYARYYNQYQPYWSGPYAWGMSQEPLFFPPNGEDPQTATDNVQTREHEIQMESIEESHLRSADETMGYTIDAQDDSFGHVEDFILDVERWKIQYLVVDTKNWLPGKKSLIDISWVKSFKWEHKSAIVDLSKEQIKSAPEFDANAPINRDYEKQLYDYYGRPYHWDEDSTLVSPY